MVARGYIGAADRPGAGAVTVLARLLDRAQLLAVVLVAAFLIVHAVVRTCTRYGCIRSFVGRWLVAQGGVLADLVITV